MSAPSGPTLYPERVLSLKFATSANPPAGPTATEMGPTPDANGDPGTEVRMPLVPTAYTETLPSMMFVT